MTERTPEPPGRAELPHILVPWVATEQSYRGRGMGGKNPLRQIGDRRGHADKLKGELETARDVALGRVAAVAPEIAAGGFALSVEGWSDEPGYKLAVQSLDTSGAKLLSVTPETSQSPDRAVVWLPFDAVSKFFTKIDQFATETTSQGNPRNQALVANIAELRLAMLHDLWQEEEQFPDPNETRWWELWLARLAHAPRSVERSAPGPDIVLRAIAAEHEWPIAQQTLSFPENVVALVRASATELTTILSTNAVPSELHRARVTSEILDLDSSFQKDLVSDLQSRFTPAGADAAAVCVLDTGLMRGHPLLQASTDYSRSALPGEPGDHVPDHAGHGTAMAGLALFGDLEHQLNGTGPVMLRHRIEAVKVIRDNHDTTTPPEMYPAVVATAAASVEDQSRRRAFSMAITVDDVRGTDGRPTAYSASLDALAFGTDIAPGSEGVELLGDPDPQASRLFVVSAGNVDRSEWKTDHLAVSDVSRVQNPAQAWNVLTVGAYTEKATLPGNQSFQGWSTVAEKGELSPFSRTSMTFGRNWPVKPDIVMEGGNLLVDASGTEFDTHDCVSQLTTRNSPFGLLTTTNATSAATAQVARLAAVAMEQYPALWPESVRGLLVHAAEWTPAMWQHFTERGSDFNPRDRKGDRLRLLRRYGWGVPTEERVLASAASSVTLLIQDEFRPFEPGSSGLTMRALRLHRLPWPREQLTGLPLDANVRMRVTLSYFVEPNPSSRGWQGRYRYSSHGLRFDVRRPLEALEDFERRLSNQASREEAGDALQPEAPADAPWFLGPRMRNTGSLHADTWEGSGAHLAESGYIGITPVGGWWKDNKRSDRAELPIRYALLVSLRTDAVATDIYTPIAAQIGIPVPVEA
jgi:Subtilase family